MANPKPLNVQQDESPGSKKRYLRTIFLKNSSPIPNWLFDELLCDSEVPHAARSVLLYLLRQTVGWDNHEKELSLEDIQYGAGVSRPIAIHALWVICDCWGLFNKTRGRKGQHSSVYAIGDLTEDAFLDRYDLVSGINGTGFPTPEQVRPKTDSKVKGQKQDGPKDHIAEQLIVQRTIRDAEDARKEEEFRRRRGKANLPQQ
jgi:hypothetical protein